MELDKIVHMNALDYLRSLDSDCVDMALTSPPYDDLRKYNGYSFDFEPIVHEAYRVLKPGGVLVWVVGDATKDGCETLTSMRQALYFVDNVGFKMLDTMIYEAKGTGAKGSNRAYWQAFEYMFILTKGRHTTINRIADVKNTTIGLIRSGRWRENGKAEKPHATKAQGIRSNIWRYSVGFADNSDKTDHPAPFPEALARDHILSWSNPGDIVLDFFMGAGTTAKMARVTGRKFIGCDISEDYCELARKRVPTHYTPDMFDTLPSQDNEPVPVQRALWDAES